MPRTAKGQIIEHSKNPAFEVALNHINTMNGKKSRPKYDILSVDNIDMQIIELMLENYSNSEISERMNKPLSTIQRRSRKLIEAGFVHPTNLIDFKKFGLRRGLLYFKCKSANLQSAVDAISKIRGVESASAYLGSLDLVAFVVYADSAEVLKIIASAQEMDLITEVTWSEEIYSKLH